MSDLTFGRVVFGPGPNFGLPSGVPTAAVDDPDWCMTNAERALRQQVAALEARIAALEALNGAGGRG